MCVNVYIRLCECVSDEYKCVYECVEYEHLYVLVCMFMCE